MSLERRAVIDVGTNSVKLLVADVAGEDVRPVFEDSKQTRLGSGFYESHLLQPDAIGKTARAVARFAAMAQGLSSTSIRGIATSAARDALNSSQLVSTVASVAGLKLEIISGEQEAQWAFRGVATDPKLAHQSLFLFDVGGGSTQLIVGRAGHADFRDSFPLGSVRLLESLPHKDPPGPDALDACRSRVRDFLRRNVRPKVERAMGESAATPAASTFQLVATGGTASILARIEAGLDTFDRERIEATRITLARLSARTLDLWSTPIEQRWLIVGLPKNRADVILAGTVICEAVLREFGFDTLRISTRGLRFGAVMKSGESSPNDLTLH